MRKLLTILNAMTRDSCQWDPEIPLEQFRLQHSCRRFAFLLPGKMHRDARKLKEGALDECTGGGNRVSRGGPNASGGQPQAKG